MPAVLSPSLLAADPACLGDQAQAVVAAGASWLHFDVMDGHFVPNLSFGADFVRALRPLCPDTTFDVHLMVEDPDRYLTLFADAGASVITVHQEACVHLQRTLASIRAAGCRAGVALNPATSPETLRYVLGDLDLVLVMTVNPGFGGQHFLSAVGKKVAELDRLRRETEGRWQISVDGGVDATNAAGLVQDGAGVLVAGSAVFRHPEGLAAGLAALKAALP